MYQKYFKFSMKTCSMRSSMKTYSEHINTWISQPTKPSQTYLKGNFSFHFFLNLNTYFYSYDLKILNLCKLLSLNIIKFVTYFNISFLFYNSGGNDVVNVFKFIYNYVFDSSKLSIEWLLCTYTLKTCNRFWTNFCWNFFNSTYTRVKEFFVWNPFY